MLKLGTSAVKVPYAKAYLGNNLVYQEGNFINFTSSIVPRGWSGTTTTAKTVYYATNEYGEWSCKASVAANSSSTVAWYAFDGDSSTYFQDSSLGSTVKTLYKMMPTGVTICPRKITIKGTAVNGTISVYGTSRRRKYGNRLWFTCWRRTNNKRRH